MSNKLHPKLSKRIRSRNRKRLAHLGKLGSDIKWNLTLNADSLGFVLSIKCESKLLDEALGSRVLSEEGESVHGGSGGDVHNGSLLLLKHSVDDVASHPCGRVDVHFDEVADFFAGEFVEVTGVAVRYSYVVDQDSDVKSFEGRLDVKLGGIVEFGVIANNDFHVYIGAFGKDFFLDGLEFRFSTRDEDNGHTLLGEGHGVGFSNSISCSGDYCIFTKFLEVLSGPKELFVYCSEKLKWDGTNSNRNDMY